MVAGFRKRGDDKTVHQHLHDTRAASTSQPDDMETTPLLHRETSREDCYDDRQPLWWRRPSVFWLLGPYMLFALAFGGTIVAKLNIIVGLVCKNYFLEQDRLHPGAPATQVNFLLGSDDPQCREPGVQKHVASFILAVNLVTGLLSAIVTPKLGHMSDRFGRTPLMAVASCGGLLGELIFILAARFPDTVHYQWLLLAAFFDGAGGSLAAGSILSQSYASDCSTPSTRAVSMGYIAAMLFAGLALGPALAGYFAKWMGSLVAVFYLAFGCHVVFIILTAFIVPESLSEEKRKTAWELWKKQRDAKSHEPSSWLSVVRASNPLLYVKQAIWVTGPGATTRLRINLILLALFNAMIMGIAIAAGAVILLYAEATFGWGNFETSRFVSLSSFIRVSSLTVILPLINYVGRTLPAARRRRASGQVGVVPEKNAGADRLDLWTLRVALTSDMLGALGYIFSRTQEAFVTSAMLTALGSMASATVQTMVTKHVPAERVGQVLGAMGTMEALGRVVGPVIFNGLYALTVGSHPHAIFVLLLGLFATAFLCTFGLKTGIYCVEEHHEEGPNAAAIHAAEADGALVVSEERMLAQ